MLAGPSQAQPVPSWRPDAQDHRDHEGRRADGHDDRLADRTGQAGEGVRRQHRDSADGRQRERGCRGQAPARGPFVRASLEASTGHTSTMRPCRTAAQGQRSRPCQPTGTCASEAAGIALGARRSDTRRHVPGPRGEQPRRVHRGLRERPRASPGVPGRAGPSHDTARAPGQLHVHAVRFRRRLHGDGTHRDVELPAGHAGWLPAQTHAGENIGESETHVLFVELKSSAAGDPAAELGPSS